MVRKSPCCRHKAISPISMSASVAGSGNLYRPHGPCGKQIIRATEDLKSLKSNPEVEFPGGHVE